LPASLLLWQHANLKQIKTERNMINLEELTIVKIARCIGCNAKTSKGIVAYLNTHKRDLTLARKREIACGDPYVSKYGRDCAIERYKAMQTLNQAKTGARIALNHSLNKCHNQWLGCSVSDKPLADYADAFVREKNPRKKNIETPRAVAFLDMGMKWFEEAIHYKGSFKGWKGSRFIPVYQSGLFVSKSGRCALLIQECIVKRKLIAPKGLRFVVDSYGVAVKRDSDGMDFHPTLEQWKAKNFVGIVRENLAINYRKRLEIKKQARASEAFNRIRSREIANTVVLLEDSRAVGNCVQGSLAYAERMGLKPEEVLAAPHMIGIKAKILIRSQDPRAIAAANRAFQRETTITI
jgi:hypothetical protein